MEFFRNPEVKKTGFIYFLISVTVIIFSVFFGKVYAVFSFCICLVFFLLYLITTFLRYQMIKKLSNEIDVILHAGDTFQISDYSEGELAILQNEVEKMTVRMREQSDALLQDKRYLTDSLADISHQLKTPLTSINLIISMLSGTNLTEIRRTELLQELTKLISRIEWLVATLLKISKIDSGTANFQSNNINVQLLLKKSLEPIAIAIELREQKVTISVGENESFQGDFMWSVEAMGNILKNCMEHTPNGGEIKITGRENAIFTEIVISDNGSGIQPEDLPHIFERFYKGENSGDGSVGIGLALARMIITEQNGTIKAENCKERGAKFTVRFYKGVI